MTQPPERIVNPLSKYSDNLYKSLSYAAPVLPVAFLVGPILILQGIYATHFGLALSTIALVILVTRLVDAITDPIIGYCSDRYYVTTRSRKPFVAAGGVLIIICSYFLYVPPDNVSGAYFLGWFVAFFVAWTLFQVPHLAWGAELADSSQGKNKIYGLRSLSAFLGKLLFVMMPLLPIFETNEFTPQTLEWSVIVSGVVMLPLLYLCLKNVPNGNTRLVSRRTTKENLWTLFSAVSHNKPYLIFLLAFFFSGVGIGMWAALMFIFIDSFLGLGDKLAIAYVISLIVAILTLAGWYKLARCLGKKLTWGIGMMLMVIGIFGKGLMSPGESGFYMLLVATTLIYSGFASLNILAPSLLADIVDYSTWKFGVDRGATYFSLYTLLSKTNVAIGGALGLATASWFGFDPNSAIHTDENILGLRLAISYTPVLILIAAVAFIVMNPMTERRHDIVRRRLNILAVRNTKYQN